MSAYGASSPWVEHRRRRLIHEDPLHAGEMLSHPPNDGLEMETGPAGPIAERRAIERHALARVYLSLSVKWQMIAELGNDDVGDQRFCRQTARYDALWRMGLNDLLGAASAGVFRTDRHQLSMAPTNPATWAPT